MNARGDSYRDGTSTLWRYERLKYSIPRGAGVKETNDECWLTLACVGATPRRLDLTSSYRW